VWRFSRLIGRIRRHWPDTRITIRGDGHYGRDEAMTWCENNGRDYMTAKSEPPLEATGSTSRRVRDNVISS